MSSTSATAPPRKSSAPLIIGVVAAFLLFGILVLGIVWLAHIRQQGNQQQAMMRAYQQRKAAFDELIARANKPVPALRKTSETSVAMAETSRALHAIDITACPVDFQRKFVDNLKAFDRLTMEIRSDTGVAAVLHALTAVRTLNPQRISSDLKALNEATLAFQDSCLDLDQCAREHGLTMAPAGAPTPVKATGTISGRVVDSVGQPVRGATVNVVFGSTEPEGGGSRPLLLATATTGDGGIYKLEAVPLGRVRVTAILRGTGSGRLTEDLEVTEGKDSMAPDIKLVQSRRGVRENG